MDKQFTLKLQEWMATPAEKRDYEQGALFLLQLTNNKILYRNISRDPKRHADFIEFKINRYLQYRLQDLTHEEVQDMQRKVDSIAAEHALDKAPSSSEEDKEALSEAAQFRAGKRADHDTLPAEIQALFVENADIMRKMRELHLQLRNLSTANSTCPDSDRYPFLKELVELDKRYHRNWQAYDNFKPEHTEAVEQREQSSSLELSSRDRARQSQSSASATLGQGGGATDGAASAIGFARMAESRQTKAKPTTPLPSAQAEVVINEEARQLQKNILRQINLAKGRYKKQPSEKLKAAIADLYGQLTAPSDALSTELKELGII